MKRFLVLLGAVLLCLGCRSRGGVRPAGSVSIVSGIGGAAGAFSVEAVTADGTLLVPAREAFGPLGAIVTWADDTRTAEIMWRNQLVVVQAGSDRALVMGTEKTMPAAPVLSGGKVMVPLLFCAETSGLSVEWDGDSRTATIREAVADDAQAGRAPLTQTLAVVQFGRYYSDAAGKVSAPIEWYVLDEKDGNRLLLSKYAVDAHPFHPELADVTWDTCGLRAWLNGDFLVTAFSEDEREEIVLSHLKAERNPRFPDEPAGADTDDRVFLLSYQETVAYLPEDADRLCKPTDYAVARGCYVNTNGDAAWWLRSPGMSGTEPEHLATWGNFSLRSHPANDTIIGDRIALWVRGR